LGDVRSTAAIGDIPGRVLALGEHADVAPHSAVGGYWNLLTRVTVQELRICVRDELLHSGRRVVRRSRDDRDEGVLHSHVKSGDRRRLAKLATIHQRRWRPLPEKGDRYEELQ